MAEDKSAIYSIENPLSDIHQCIALYKNFSCSLVVVNV